MKELIRSRGRFLWEGSFDSTKKYHLIAWEHVCKSKSEGG